MTPNGLVVAVVQARMGSTRLPGKVLEPLAGTTVLGLLLARAGRSERLDRLVVATTTEPADDAVEAEACRLGADVVRGPVDDVLARYLLALDQFAPTTVVRLTGDCPLTDPALVDAAVEPVATGEADVVSNGSQGFLRGFDVEAVRADVLRVAAAEATLPHERTHVTSWLYDHPDRFRIRFLPWPADHSALRLTVDTPTDLDVVRTVCERVADPATATWRDLAQVLVDDPALAARNAAVRQKAIEEG